MSDAWEILRIVVVLALLIAAALLATPKGRLPLALRGVMKIMRRDRGLGEAEIGGEGAAETRGRRGEAKGMCGEAKVLVSRRILAFLLVLLAAVLSIV